MTNDEIVQQLRTLLQAILQPPARSGVNVFTGTDLQSAIDAAPPLTSIWLAPGSVYTGNFVLKSGVSLSNSEGLQDPRIRSRFPKIVTPNAQPAIAAPSGENMGLYGLEIAGDGGNDLVTLGDGSSAQTSLSQVPHHITVQSCYLHGSPANGQKRGIALNSADTIVRGCYFDDFKRRGQDTQALGGWNGPGGYQIFDNTFIAAGENVIFGGADPAIPNLVTEHISIIGNTFRKPLEWRTQGWQVKNLLEFKNARHVYVAENTFEGCWPGFTQDGYAILLTPRNQEGGAPWVQVADVTIENNIIRNCAGGFEILGTDDTHPSQRTTGIKILNNLLENIDPVLWNGPNGELGTGRLFAILNGPDGVEIAHNTGIGAHLNSWLTLGGDPTLGLIIRDNVFDEGDYGLKINAGGEGLAALLAHSPGSRLVSNIILNATADRFIDYGADNGRSPNNTFPTVTSSDGTPIGADQSKLPA